MNPSLLSNSRGSGSLRRSHSNPSLHADDHDSRPSTNQPASAHGWVVEHHVHNLIRAVSRDAPRSWLSRSSGNGSNSFDEKDDPEQGPTKQTNGRIPQILEISFAEMQRMRLRKLQCKLIEHAAAMSISDEAAEPDHWEKDLQDYIQALKDYEYMSTAISAQSQDPFIASSEDSVVKWILQRILYKKEESWPADDVAIVPKSVWKDICFEPSGPSVPGRSMPSVSFGVMHAPPIGGTRRSNARKSKLRSLRGRLATAALAAVFLVVPMWLMVLKHTKWTALISSTVFVLVFGWLMAVSLEKPMEVLSATAAYAAVLVVFVGAISFGV
ncbi:hypothetical protein BDV96DRAFT_582376 [Lophiotrema nucula]|uniref:DUF6594 domain-containing protein n=1 Tax=Lophiotrema nucula TaxID=690887 RepID=A0A6A5YWE5_9PLEO|nr:hypothetical protein BDV96DRAFT_582376 [Lophiotrema nucula]